MLEKSHLHHANFGSLVSLIDCLYWRFLQVSLFAEVRHCSQKSAGLAVSFAVKIEEGQYRISGV